MVSYEKILKLGIYLFSLCRGGTTWYCAGLEKPFSFKRKTLAKEKLVLACFLRDIWVQIPAPAFSKHLSQHPFLFRKKEKPARKELFSLFATYAFLASFSKEKAVPNRKLFLSFSFKFSFGQPAHTFSPLSLKREPGLREIF